MYSKLNSIKLILCLKINLR